jgi:hypothetical protein
MVYLKYQFSLLCQPPLTPPQGGEFDILMRGHLVSLGKRCPVQQRVTCDATHDCTGEKNKSQKAFIRVQGRLPKKARPAGGRGVPGVLIFKPSLEVALCEARGLGRLAFLNILRENNVMDILDQPFLKT